MSPKLVAISALLVSLTAPSIHATTSGTTASASINIKMDVSNYLERKTQLTVLDAIINEDIDILRGLNINNVDLVFPVSGNWVYIDKKRRQMATIMGENGFPNLVPEKYTDITNVLERADELKFEGKQDEAMALLVGEPFPKDSKEVIFIPSGKDTISIAALIGNTDVVKLLVDSDFDYGGMADAIKFGNLDVVKFFLDRGANVNEMLYEGRPLYIALLYNRNEVANFLLNMGADPSLDVQLGSEMNSFTVALEMANALIVDTILSKHEVDTVWRYSNPIANTLLPPRKPYYGKNGGMDRRLELLKIFRKHNINVSEVYFGKDLLSRMLEDHQNIQRNKSLIKMLVDDYSKIKNKNDFDYKEIAKGAMSKAGENQDDYAEILEDIEKKL